MPYNWGQTQLDGQKSVIRMMYVICVVRSEISVFNRDDHLPTLPHSTFPTDTPPNQVQLFRPTCHLFRGSRSTGDTQSDGLKNLAIACLITKTTEY